MSNLFICVTPLELIIVKKIIIKEKIAKKDCNILYFVDEINSRNVHYLNNLQKFSENTNFFLLNKYRYPFYFTKLKQEIKKYKNLKNIFLAAIDSQLIQFVISKFNFENIFTFDDGIGNLTEKYNMDFSPTLYKKFLYWVAGVRYNKKDILRQSKKHYSIYNDDNNNFSKNPTFIGELFEKKTISKNNSCSLVISPVFRDLFSENEETSMVYVIKKYRDFLDSISSNNVFFLQHPRELNFSFNSKKLKKISTNFIAEDYITNILFKKFGRIDLYSFPVSTVSVNLKKYKNIKNFFLLSKFIPKRSKAALKVAKRLKIKYKSIDLDRY
ncbi:glycosyltransferase family 52 protein [Candidatus Pelagibacter sp.]|nr:glycosyltransferase family 52 protein [Candidatus Pelagibacter sp.]